MVFHAFWEIVRQVLLTVFEEFSGVDLFKIDAFKVDYLSAI